MNFSVWMKVEIGTLDRPTLTELNASNLCISSRVRAMILKDTFPIVFPNPKKLVLGRCRIHDFGILNNATMETIRDAVVKEGCEICPAEVAPYAHRRIKRQRNQLPCWFIMEPINDEKEIPCFFRLNLGHDCVTWNLNAISAMNGTQERLLNRGEEVVFVIPDKK